MVKKYLILNICLIFYVGQINTDPHVNTLSMIETTIAEEIHDLEKNHNKISEATTLIFPELMQTWLNIHNEMKKYRQDRLDYYAEQVANHDNCSDIYHNLEIRSLTKLVGIGFKPHEMLTSADELIKSNLRQADYIKEELNKINNLAINYFNNDQQNNIHNLMKKMTEIKIRKDLYIVELRKLPNKMKLMINNLKDQSYVKMYGKIMSNLEKKIKDCITPQKLI